MPTYANSLLFKAEGGGTWGGPLVVSMGGVELPFSAISAQTNYTLYGADISGFAGQVEQLMFTALPGVNNYWTLDDIQFSTQLIPEPSVFGLAALGAGLVAWRVLRRRR
ncbi:MAG: PEP-CTERM sorting domain-containing protein [Verrucomicrobia bacterium]|nr:PEP-CTERM sorting domain-containing protein [Verrucomicrobiota bacterium]